MLYAVCARHGNTVCARDGYSVRRSEVNRVRAVACAVCARYCNSISARDCDACADGRGAEQDCEHESEESPQISGHKIFHSSTKFGHFKDDACPVLRVAADSTLSEARLSLCRVQNS